MFEEELFTFVLDPKVEATNNAVERLERPIAQHRNCGRTSKTARGAHRRSVIESVLESLRASLPAFTLASLLAEVTQWMKDGISRFRQQLDELQDVSHGVPPPVYQNAQG